MLSRTQRVSAKVACGVLGALLSAAPVLYLRSNCDSLMQSMFMWWSARKPTSAKCHKRRRLS